MIDRMVEHSHGLHLAPISLHRLLGVRVSCRLVMGIHSTLTRDVKRLQKVIEHFPALTVGL